MLLWPGMLAVVMSSAEPSCLILCHRYAWADVMPLGKLAVNLSGPTTKGLAALLHQLIAGLSTQVSLAAL